MTAFARWTNLSETTFLLTPTDPAADYRVRIFTPVDELPFAGHPTLGSARAWLEQGGVPRSDGHLVQQCRTGLVRIRQAAGQLAFAAPPLVRSDRLDETDVGLIAHALRLDTDDVVDAQWADNGPGWVALLLTDAETVLALQPPRACPEPPSASSPRSASSAPIRSGPMPPSRSADLPRRTRLGRIR